MTFFRAIFLLLGLSSFGKAMASPEAAFWAWFQKNDGVLYEFERNQEAVFDRLATEMQKVNPTLTFEFGPKENGQREFVISADGIRDAFPSVEKLYAAAPQMEHWKVIKFRPRRPPFNVTYQGISVDVSSVSVLIEPDGPKAALTVFIPGFNASMGDRYRGIGYLLLDQALGEFDVETRVGFIDVAAPSPRPAKAVSLKDLPVAFDGFFQQR
jgi:hypothetical protein